MPTKGVKGIELEPSICTYIDEDGNVCDYLGKIKNINEEFPKKAKYKRDKNRIYFMDDFKDGEEIEFAYKCDKPSSNAIGNVWYRSCESGYVNLVNIKDLNY